MEVGIGKEDLEIQYTALSFIKSNQIHFKYRLEGLDSSWIDAGERRIAYYSHIPPGKYSFQVIARNSDGIWNNEGKTLAITVLAPFYRKWWFELLVFLAVAALAVAAWRYRVRQLERAHELQQAFSRQLIESQENERTRIAAELHDGLGQRLIVIKNLTTFLLRSKKRNIDNLEAETLEEISSEAVSAIKEAREISYDLRPFQLDQLGLTNALEAMIRTVSMASEIEFSTELDNIDDLFAEELRINFYRIVQESLNNIMKHSQATEVSIRLKRQTENITLAIHDNGRGFTLIDKTSRAASRGFGLTNMAERTSLLGGSFNLWSAPKQGTTMIVEIPLKATHHA
jgi:signal transduction histidine kinase